jgi:Low-density lipoprotein receptor repeat class B.
MGEKLLFVFICHWFFSLMFWTDWVSSTSQKGKIEQAWMDGTNRKSLIESHLQWPNGLSIDYVEKKLYWCDAFLDKIERAGLDGSKREVCSMADCWFGLPLESHLSYTIKHSSYLVFGSSFLDPNLTQTNPSIRTICVCLPVWYIHIKDQCLKGLLIKIFVCMESQVLVMCMNENLMVMWRCIVINQSLFFTLPCAWKYENSHLCVSHK